MLMRPCDASNHWPPLFNASIHGCALSNASNYWSVLSDASNHTANAFPASVQCTTVPLGSAFLYTLCFSGHVCFSKCISGGHNASGVEVLLHYSEGLYESSWCITAF